METVCASDLNVAFLIGFGIELGATLIDTWMGRQTLMKMSVGDELIKLSIGSLMIVLGMSNIWSFMVDLDTAEDSNYDGRRYLYITFVMVEDIFI